MFPSFSSELHRIVDDLPLLVMTGNSINAIKPTHAATGLPRSSTLLVCLHEAAFLVRAPTDKLGMWRLIARKGHGGGGKGRAPTRHHGERYLVRAVQVFQKIRFAQRASAERWEAFALSFWTASEIEDHLES